MLGDQEPTRLYRRAGKLEPNAKSLRKDSRGGGDIHASQFRRTRSRRMPSKLEVEALRKWPHLNSSRNDQTLFLFSFRLQVQILLGLSGRLLANSSAQQRSPSSGLADTTATILLRLPAPTTWEHECFKQPHCFTLFMLRRDAFSN